MGYIDFLPTSTPQNILPNHQNVSSIHQNILSIYFDKTPLYSTLINQQLTSLKNYYSTHFYPLISKYPIGKIEHFFSSSFLSFHPLFLSFLPLTFLSSSSNTPLISPSSPNLIPFISTPPFNSPHPNFSKYFVIFHYSFKKFLYLCKRVERGKNVLFL